MSLPWWGPSRAMSLPWRGPSRARASMIPLLVCPETSHSSSHKSDWLPFGGLLINLSILHRVSVILAAFFGPWWPDRSSPCGVWSNSVSTHFLVTLLGKISLALLHSRISCPSPVLHRSISSCLPLPLHLAQKADRIWFWPLGIALAIVQCFAIKSARWSISRSWSTKVLHHKLLQISHTTCKCI